MSELQPFSAVRSLAEPMTVLETGVYRGPHYFSHTPFVRKTSRSGGGGL
jgi:hypothetical protein